jgi:SiaC family regulatory phosphoprotein
MKQVAPKLAIAPTTRSPQIEFDFETGRFLLRGESYPEDAARFFGPLLQAVQDFIASGPEGEVVFDLSLAYFNSSTAKALMNLFEMLERAAGRGTRVVVNWHFAADDDAMREFGEDFSLDFEACTFNLCADAGG